MAKRKKKAASRVPSPGPAPARARSALLYAGGALAAFVLLLVAGGAILLASGGGDDATPASGDKTAVIVDQLSLTQPNPDFVSQAREILAQGGYAVDYFKGEDVTVDFYRTLPSRGYDLVLMRVHAGITTEVSAETGEKVGTEYVSLFTGEPYDATKYSSEQLNRLGKATYYEGGEPLFGIGPEFVESSMEGDFGGALLVMMGCDGLRSQRTGQAFLDRGAGAFVSWTKPVSGPHTDDATAKLLRHLLLESMTLEDAVSQTASEVGPDPNYDGELRVLTG